MKGRHLVCKVGEIPEGSKMLVKVGRRTIGVFNVRGTHHALLNLCPHTGGSLCEGPVGGTNVPCDMREGYRYEFGRAGEILRCALHGWEFEIASGRCLTDPKVRAKTYPVEEEDGKVYVVA